jgi:hypothetical protein
MTLHPLSAGGVWEKALVVTLLAAIRLATINVRARMRAIVGASPESISIRRSIATEGLMTVLLHFVLVAVVTPFMDFNKLRMKEPCQVKI